MDDWRFERTSYSPMQRLTAGDLQNQQDYDSQKRRLVNRELLGWGVVRGLKVDYGPSGDGLLLGAGLALDLEGREILVPHPTPIGPQELFGGRHPGPGVWYACLRYRELPCGSGEILGEDGGHSPVPNRVREGFSLNALLSPGADEICLARFEVTHGGGLSPVIARLRSPVDGFYPCPLLDGAVTGEVRLVERLPGADTAYSRETAHGLGPGEVEVTLWAEGWQEERRCAVSGTAELFGAPFSLAVKLFPDTGTFVAAVRCHGPGNTPLPRLRYFARRARPLEREDGGGTRP